MADGRSHLVARAEWKNGRRFQYADSACGRKAVRPLWPPKASGCQCGVTNVSDRVLGGGSGHG